MSGELLRSTDGFSARGLFFTVMVRMREVLVDFLVGWEPLDGETGPFEGLGLNVVVEEGGVFLPDFVFFVSYAVFGVGVHFLGLV